MKKNSSLKKFMANELSAEESKNIKAGWDANDPRNNNSAGTGVGNGSALICFYDDLGELVCINPITGEIVPYTGG